MTLTLTLPPEVEKRLVQEAARHGLPVETYALQVLARQFSLQSRGGELVSLLQSWIDEADPAEQQETGDFLVRALDADRLSDRPLFPPELKGVTW